MKKLRIPLVFGLEQLRLEYDDGIERSPEMMTLLISWSTHVETKWKNAGKLPEVAEKDDIDAAKFHVVLGGFCGAELS
jgi:hypothetical protein